MKFVFDCWSDAGHLYGFDELDDFILIGDDGDHLFFHLFVYFFKALSNSYVFGIFLNQIEYFLENKVIDGVFLYFLSMTSILLLFYSFYLLCQHLFCFPHLFFADVVLENKQFFVNECFVKVRMGSEIVYGRDENIFFFSSVSFMSVLFFLLGCFFVKKMFFLVNLKASLSDFPVDSIET